jgi:anti-sigma B factor antagonist
MLTIQREHGPGHTICRPVGDLDAFTVSQFRQVVADLAGVGRLIIDLSATTFVDSAGLGALIGGIRRTRELGGDVAVACDRPALVRLLRTTGFDRIVTVAPTVFEAVATLPGRREASNPPILVDRLDDDADT